MMRLKEIAEKVGGVLHGNGEVEIKALASIDMSGPGDITFVLNRSFEKYLPACRASAVITGQDVSDEAVAGRNVIRVRNAGVAYAAAAELFRSPLRIEKGVHRLAFVGAGARVSDRASIQAHAYIDEDAVIENDVVVYPFTYVGKRSVIGEGTLLYPHVTVYHEVVIGKRVIVHSGAVLGSDGFAYVWDGEKHRKIPQIGALEIGDDVEIGANTAIDRASLAKTVIGPGVKIDNLVQIAHNVSIGANSIMVSQVGIAGSTTIGRNVIFGGKVGVRDHATIGNNVRAAGGTGITSDVKDNETVAGTPHMPHREWLRLQAYIRKLPQLFDRIKKLEAGAQHDGD